ncbi:MAG: signal peptidase I, partial [Allosphingosinicella sp.]
MDRADRTGTMLGARPGVRKKEGLASLTRFLIFLFLFSLVLRTFVVAPFVIPSGSMLPRMMIGDFLFVAKWPYGISRFSIPFGLGSFKGRWFAGEPERGDIIVFRYPGRDDDYVKRLVGLPGDRIQMRGGQLFLNGKAVPKVRIADYLMPMTPNSPCRYVDPSRARVIEQDGRKYCSYVRYRETLPGGRSYEVLDEASDGPGDDTQ